MDQRSFVALVSPAAKESAKTTNIPAGFTIAQGALESAWGESTLFKRGSNLFGVKADKSWLGDTISLPTREFIGGKWIVIDAKWRKYTDLLACINDHALFFQVNPRYRLAMTGQRSSEDFARAIAIAGYATDPRYAEKLCQVIRKYNLSVFDA